MTLPGEVPLAERRRALRAKMLAQRDLIARGLDRGSIDDYDFPRSRTMKFLTRPGLATTLLAGAAAFLVGGRYARSLAVAMSMARIMRSTGRDKPGTPAG